LALDHKTEGCESNKTVCSNNEYLATVKLYFGLLQFLISTLVLVFLLIKRAPLKFKNHWHTFYQNGMMG
jgi:hypothetical protein